MPKSTSFTRPPGVSMTLAGLTSRWTIPRSWALPSPAAIWAAIPIVSATGSGPRSSRSRSVPPSQKAMAMNRAPSPVSSIS